MIPLYKVRDFGESINVTFEFIRANAKKLFLSVLFSSGSFGVILGIAYASFYQTLWSGENVGSLNSFNLVIVVMFAFLLPISVISTVLQYMLRYFELGGNKDIEVKDIVSRSFKNIGSVFVLAFIYYVLATLGILFCILPGIYLFVALSPVYMVHAIEKRGIIDAFSKTLNSYSGGWWLSFGLYLVLSLILGFALGIFSVPSAILSVLAISIGNEYSWIKPLSMLFQVLQNLANVFVYAVLMVAVFFRYGSLREANEAISFKSRIEDIGQNKTEANETHDLRKRGYIDEDEDY